MGRTTKAQKETRRAKGVPEGSKDGRRKGFNTMPVKAPKTAYLGKGELAAHTLLLGSVQA